MTLRALLRTPACSRFASGRAAKGVSLLLALIFVIFFGSILITLARYNSYEIRISEARVAGWEMVEISKAARLYVRDRYAADPTLRTTAATPSRITLDTLRLGGYLPTTFGRNAAGTDLSALNQHVHVILTNWSGNGSLGGPTTDVTTVPNAFVYFDNNGKTAPDLMVDAVETARRLGASINGVLFDRDGNNRSSECRGAGPAVSIWDTGCLTDAEFRVMANAIGISDTFAGGALIMPAWKSVQPDLRAVLRFPQPENPGFATMLTDLQMGTPTGNCTLSANQVLITTVDSTGAIQNEDTGLCDVNSDDAANNRRFNIDRVGNIQAQRMITEAQAQDFGGEAASIGTAQDDTMRITGNMTMNNDLQVYNVRPLPAGATHRMNVPAGTLAIERNSYLYSTSGGAGPPSTIAGIATIGTATARNLVSDQLDTPDFRSTNPGIAGALPQMSVTDRTTLTGNTTVRDPAGVQQAEFITEQMSAPGATLRASDDTNQVQVANTMSLRNSQMTVNGTQSTNQYAAVIGEVTNAGLVNVTGATPVTATPDLRMLQANGSITANSTRAYDGVSPMRIIDVNNYSTSAARCLESANLAGGCPERQYFPPNITP